MHTKDKMVSRVNTVEKRRVWGQKKWIRVNPFKTILSERYIASSSIILTKLHLQLWQYYRNKLCICLSISLLFLSELYYDHSILSCTKLWQYLLTDEKHYRLLLISKIKHFRVAPACDYSPTNGCTCTYHAICISIPHICVRTHR